MKMPQLSFFDAEKRYEKITELGDPLEKLNSIMNWEMFREKLTAVCQKEDYTKGGRPSMSLSSSKLLYSAEFTICRLTRSNTR